MLLRIVYIILVCASIELSVLCAYACGAVEAYADCLEILARAPLIKVKVLQPKIELRVHGRPGRWEGIE